MASPGPILSFGRIICPTNHAVGAPRPWAGSPHSISQPPENWIVLSRENQETHNNLERYQLLEAR